MGLWGAYNCSVPPHGCQQLNLFLILFPMNLRLPSFRPVQTHASHLLFETRANIVFFLSRKIDCTFQVVLAAKYIFLSRKIAQYINVLLPFFPLVNVLVIVKIVIFWQTITFLEPTTSTSSSLSGSTSNFIYLVKI